SPPIIVVIKETGILTGGSKPELQLAFKTVQQVVESVRVLLLSDGKELGDSGHLLATEIGVPGSVVISLVDDSIKQPLQRRGGVVWRRGKYGRTPLKVFVVVNESPLQTRISPRGLAYVKLVLTGPGKEAY